MTKLNESKIEFIELAHKESFFRYHNSTNQRP